MRRLGRSYWFGISLPAREECTAGDRGEEGAGRIERTGADRGVAHPHVVARDQGHQERRRTRRGQSKNQLERPLLQLLPLHPAALPRPRGALLTRMQPFAVLEEFRRSAAFQQNVENRPRRSLLVRRSTSNRI